VGWTWKPPKVLPVEAQYPRPSPPYSSASRPEAFVVHAVVKAGDIVAVTIEKKRRSPLPSPDNLLARLAPARMRHLRIDIGPEAILCRLQRFPHAPRTLISEAEGHNRLDGLEAVFPGQRETQRRTMLPGEWMPIGTGD